MIAQMWRRLVGMDALPPRQTRMAHPNKLSPCPDKLRVLNDAELTHIRDEKTCPYCDGDLFEGPDTSVGVNLLCRTDGCWASFNYCGGWMGQYLGQKIPVE